MLQKLAFHPLVQETITVKRIPRVMPLYQFIPGIMLGIYVGFARLHQLPFVARDPILRGVLKVTQLPPQCTLGRFPASLHLHVARQIPSI
jgi:hypothetical protein